MSRNLIAIILIAFVLVPLPGAAQSSSLRGTVTDPQNGLIPSVVVTATNLETAVMRSTISDETGAYSLAVPAGKYLFDFFAPFPSQVVSVEGRPVTVDRSMTMDVTLADANP